MTAANTLVLIKPKMRGWLHAGTAPTAAIFGILLVVLAPPQLRLVATVYALTAVALFTVSATYHRGNWGNRAEGAFQRLDHAAIFLFIAGSYTALFTAIFATGSATVLLWIIWIAALMGVAFKLFWIGVPKWITIPVYLTLGWAAVFYIPAIWDEGGALIFLLVAGGGLAYTVGAIIYGTRRPDPSPKWFGFHEIFHSCTIGGYVSHYVGIALAFGAVAAV